MAERTGPVGVGLIGAGNISTEYLTNLCRFPDIAVLAVGDMRSEVARARAEEHDLSIGGDPAVVLDHPDVEIVVNLTTPAAHATVAEQAIAAGKHVWNEKPLALDRASARHLLDAAAAAGLRVGCAPDTFLGVGLQTVRRAIDGGLIGEPQTAIAIMQSPGPEAWHPNPAFLFQVGAGPLFDIGPYYLTTLVQAFGAIESVAAAGSTARPSRVVGSGPLAGQPFDVTTPSHVGSLLRFVDGGSAQTIQSFDAPQFRVQFEITGTEGTLIIPDPNLFDGEIGIHRRGADAPEILERTTRRSTRGTGVLEMARAIRAGRPHRADGTLGYHVLDTMVSTLESVERAEVVRMESRTPRPAPLPHDWDPDAATLTR